ncbi:MAG: DUF86 domain-containing protein [Deltaproteobacteria bacterium]|nr:DUF86 domain-containing protein [Deltaproteobacteria bacterium]
MLEAARLVRSYVSGRQRPDLDSDTMLRDAVIRQLEVLGEAAARASDGTRSANPAIPWASIVGMRNELIHAYHRVDLDIVWRTAIEAIPQLAGALETMGVE